YPKFIGNGESDQEQSLPREWKAKDVIRSGIRISTNIFYNSIEMPSCASTIPMDQESIPANIKTFWFCQYCNKIYTFNRMQAVDHLSQDCSTKSNKENCLQIEST
ncbi:uncharacterized protein B0P05DRAFT_467574, partial [Gilbertella persicaria]|uniref:uncharacterized protein n=1 Tax=Gilbertella persicaria TaxID=101096 RepID=UPI00221E5913